MPYASYIQCSTEGFWSERWLVQSIPEFCSPPNATEMRLNIFAPIMISLDTSFQSGVTPLAALVRQVSTEAGNSSRAERTRIMPSHSLDLVHRMRAALNEVMTKVPTEQATPEVKAYLAEIILKAAAGGQTDYEVLLAAASAQIQTVLSQLVPPASAPPTRG